MGMSSLAIAVSGLNAAQAGLYVTGHNLANSGTEGFSRQRAVQVDAFSSRVGENSLGVFQKGLGVDIKAIVQLRDRFLDEAYRLENCRLGYYTSKSATGVEIEAIIGETQGQYNFQSVVTSLWDALNELAAHPEGLETRGNFIATAVSFITKASDVYNRLFEYQHNLDDQIRAQANEANSLVSQINKLNGKIAGAVASGDHANDFRDQRSVCMDKLSKILDVNYKEKWDSTVNITSEGKELLANGTQRLIGLKYLSNEYTFVEPVITGEKGILPPSAPVDKFEPLFTFAEPVNADYGNDTGSLKGLMISRGTRPTDYRGAGGLVKPTLPNPAYPGGASDPKYLSDMYRYNNDVYSQENCFIPFVMRDMDSLVHAIAVLIDSSVAPVQKISASPPKWGEDPNHPFDLNGNVDPNGNPYPGAEVFVLKNPNGPDPRDQEDYYSLYTTANIKVNPKLLQAGGANLLALSPPNFGAAPNPSWDREDNRLILRILEQWGDKLVGMNGDMVSANDGYKQLITYIGAETAKNMNFLNEQGLLAEQTNEKRNTIMGASLDEELKNMMIYQHAYGAAARILNVIDNMLDRLVNGMGA